MSISVNAHGFMVSMVFPWCWWCREKQPLLHAVSTCFLIWLLAITEEQSKVSSTALGLCWVVVLESHEPGRLALAAQSQRASKHFIPSQRLAHTDTGLRGESKGLTPIQGAGCLPQTQVHGAVHTYMFSKKRLGTKQALLSCFSQTHPLGKSPCFSWGG